MAGRNLRYAGAMGKGRAGAPPDLAGLEQAALRYLERYASSAAGLRRVLRRRIQRAARGGQGEAEPGLALVEAVVERLTRSGLLDDARYAEHRAASLARRGGSLHVIRRDLQSRGVAGPQIDAALAALKRETASGTNDEADRAAALALARRRRLGPFRAAGQRPAFRLRDLAALGRAGFAYEIARAVIDGDPEIG